MFFLPEGLSPWAHSAAGVWAALQSHTPADITMHIAHCRNIFMNASNALYSYYWPRSPGKGYGWGRRGTRLYKYRYAHVNNTMKHHKHVQAYITHQRRLVLSNEFNWCAYLLLQPMGIMLQTGAQLLEGWEPLHTLEACWITALCQNVHLLSTNDEWVQTNTWQMDKGTICISKALRLWDNTQAYWIWLSCLINKQEFRDRSSIKYRWTAVDPPICPCAHVGSSAPCSPHQKQNS